MIRRRFASGIGTSMLASLAAGAAALGLPGPCQASTERHDAAMNYRLHCEGCHKEDGSGQAGYIPALRGHVSRFLATPEGRAYIARVPGTAQSLLDDEERAEVLNWIVRTFDPEHLPADFSPYTAAELARWRFDALSAPTVVRATLLAQLDRSSPAAVRDSIPSTAPTAAASAASPAGQPAKPPASFVICAACHTTSPDGVAGMGPNLHGVVGREAGAAPGFTFSAAMKSAGFKWTREALDAYLLAPSTKVPGNYMIYAGQPDPNERKAIIDYLETLR